MSDTDVTNDWWRRKCDRLRDEMDTRLRDARSLPAAIAVVLSHVRERAESLEPSLLAVNDRLDNGPRETGEFADSADRLIAMLEALASKGASSAQP